MTPFARYPVRPRVQPGESLAGYLYRFYNENHHKVPALALAAAMQVYQGSEAKQATANSILSVLFGKVAHLDVRYWQTRQLLPSATGHVQSSPAPQAQAATQFCPACIEERQIHKALWELPFVEACPVHETALLESCPTCDRPYTWSSLSHDWACRCEIPISEHTCQRATRKQVQLARFMARVDSAWSTRDGKAIDDFTLANLHAALVWLDEAVKTCLRVWPAGKDRPNWGPAQRLKFSLRVMSGPEQETLRILRRLLLRHCFPAGEFPLVAATFPGLLNTFEQLLATALHSGNLLIQQLGQRLQAMIGTARIKPDALGGIYRSARLSDINWTSGRVALSIWWAKLVPIFISMPPVDRYRDLEANQPAKNTLITGILNSWWAAANTKRQHPRFDLLCQRWQVRHAIKHEINADEILEVLASYLATLRASELHFILDLTKECMNFGGDAYEEAVS